MPGVWQFIQRVRARFNSRWFDRDFNFESMRGKFVFYPLQYTPESSINVPDPFFVDQLRVIDALRYAMPSEFVLLVKEHPAALGVRRSRFMKQVLQRPGVRVVKWDTPISKLIDCAALTVSVTGTATLEAFLHGRPSITLAPTFFSGLVRCNQNLNSLSHEMKSAILYSPSHETVVAGVEKLLASSREFVSLAPETRNGVVLSGRNLQNLVRALRDWVDFESAKFVSNPSETRG